MLQAWVYRIILLLHLVLAWHYTSLEGAVAWDRVGGDGQDGGVRNWSQPERFVSRVMSDDVRFETMCHIRYSVEPLTATQNDIALTLHTG